MNGIRFYLEYENPTEKNKGTRKEPGNHEGNVFAAFVANGTHHCEVPGGCIEGLGAVYFQRNSPVCSTSASWDHLGKYCLRISEAQAREIHPRLFEVLDQEP